MVWPTENLENFENLLKIFKTKKIDIMDLERCLENFCKVRQSHCTKFLDKISRFLNNRWLLKPKEDFKKTTLHTILIPYKLYHLYA